MITECTLLVWDEDGKLPLDRNDVACWRSYTNAGSEKIFSVSELTEENADRLRSKYLALIYDLGESIVKGRRIVDYLEIRPGFSYWWMTLLAEKCNWAKSPQIDNAIKLLAFQEWLVGKDYKHISLVSSNAALAEAMRLLTIEVGVGFEWQQLSASSDKNKLVKRIYNWLPYTYQALVWLIRHLITRWPLKGVGVDQWKQSKATTTFVSYLFNLVPASSKQERYESRYWAALPDLLVDNQVATNWLHFYVEGSLLPNASTARNIISQFNESHIGSQVHVSLHSFLGFSLIVRVLRDWYKLLRLEPLFCKQIEVESGYLWPLFKKDCHVSMVGTAAMSNLLYLCLFEEAMSDLPRQERGCYLQENQGWEFGFIYSWETGGHGRSLMGFPHSTIRYWDLRYFFDPGNYVRTGNCDLPLPDFVGMNGDAAKRIYLDSGYPKDDLVEVEALRYLYLADLANRESIIRVNEVGEKAVLVLGDYLKENTVQQMELLRTAVQFIDEPIQYIIKPHPACPIREEDYPELRMVVVTDSISTIIDQCLLAYTSSMTSAAVDAYCAGKPVVTVLDPKGLNLSPLRGREGVSFVSTPEELATVLNGIGKIKNIERQEQDYFYLDPELPRWRRVMEDNIRRPKR